MGCLSNAHGVNGKGMMSRRENAAKGATMNDDSQSVFHDGDAGKGAFDILGRPRDAEVLTLVIWTIVVDLHQVIKRMSRSNIQVPVYYLTLYMYLPPRHVELPQQSIRATFSKFNNVLHSGPGQVDVETTCISDDHNTQSPDPPPTCHLLQGAVAQITCSRIGQDR